MNKISSKDRSALIRLASSLPAGDPSRKAILAGLKKASLELSYASREELAEFSPQIIKAVMKYLRTSRPQIVGDFSTDDVDFVEDDPEAPNPMRDGGTVFTFGSAMQVGSAVKVDRSHAGYGIFYFVEPF